MTPQYSSALHLVNVGELDHASGNCNQVCSIKDGERPGSARLGTTKCLRTRRKAAYYILTHLNVHTRTCSLPKDSGPRA